MLAAAGGQTWEERIERTLPAWKGAFSLVLLAADHVIAVRDRGGSDRCRSGACPTADTQSRARRARSPHSDVSTSPRSARARWSRSWRRDRPGTGARFARHAAPAARSSSCTSPGPTRCGTAATSITSASDSGSELARESPTAADVVIPVPDSSIPTAIGYSAESGIRFNDGLIKNRYIGRTFIEPTQDIRERGVALKFNALRGEPRGPTGGDDRRFARSRHDRRATGEAGA